MKHIEINYPSVAEAYSKIMSMLTLSDLGHSIKAVIDIDEKSPYDGSYIHVPEESDNTIDKVEIEKIADKLSIEHRKQRESCGIKDPITLDEIENSYYAGVIWTIGYMKDKASIKIKMTDDSNNVIENLKDWLSNHFKDYAYSAPYSGSVSVDFDTLFEDFTAYLNGKNKTV